MKRKAITPEAMQKAYKKCRERERIREYKRRQTKQGKFESSFVSYDAILDDPDGATDKLRCAGALGSVITEPDFGNLPVKNRNKLIAACTKLRRHGNEHLVRTLQLIAKNGTNREESICQLVIDAQKSTKQQKDSTTGIGKNSASSSVSRSTGRSGIAPYRAKRARRGAENKGRKGRKLQSPEKK